ncbi:uncharacterized protein [Antedon mediterranea]|uniref:uncharacterized protein isoform X2 n=1 Tax=Antedon mediterranea TaxID=105859 RepID=UPI003AF4237D
MATEFSVALVNFSAWCDDQNLFRQLRVLYRDLIAVTDIDKARKTIDLLHKLVIYGHLSYSEPSLLYQTIKITQTFGVIKLLEHSFPDVQEIKITNFAPYRHWIVNLGIALGKEDIDKIDALYNGSAAKNYEDAWSMIWDLENRKILCKERKEEFINDLRKIGLESRVKPLTEGQVATSSYEEQGRRKTVKSEIGTADDNTPAEIRCRAIKRFVVDEDVEQQDTSACKSWIDEHVFIIIGAVMLILVVVAVSVTLGLLSIESNSTESTTMAIGTTTHEASAWLMGDCGNISQFYPVSGEYVIQPSEGGPQINVYCDIREDGKWTVIQRRQDGSVDFYRNWKEYKEGFGNVNTEFWLGNEQINRLTADGNFELMVEMTDHLNVTKFAKYSQFHVGTEDSNYVLTISGYTGTAGIYEEVEATVCV